MDNPPSSGSLEALQQSAQAGDPEAQNALGLIYEEGRGVLLPDPVQAAYYYRLAATQGYAHGQYNLGRCFDEGLGLQQDLSEAANWYKLAADQGHSDAQNSLGGCYEEGTGVSQDVSEALKWYRLFAEQGNAKVIQIVCAQAS